MATRTTITLEDDLDGGPADETLRFHLGAAEYEIDLNAKNARAFRRQLAPFVEHARQEGRAPRHRAARSASARKDSAAIHEWAKAQGMQISERGRIPASVIEQFEAAKRR